MTLSQEQQQGSSIRADLYATIGSTYCDLKSMLAMFKSFQAVRWDP